MADTVSTTVAPGYTARGIVQLLRDRHAGTRAGEFLFCAELRVGTGYKRGEEQRLDAWAMACWPSANFERVTYEVKVSRSDFLVEIKEPRKRRMGLLYSNRFYFVAPAGLVKVEEVPPECGLIEVGVRTEDWGRDEVVTVGPWELREYLVTRVKAPWRDTPPPSWSFLASVGRHLRGRGE